jgi:hypothetical protein
MIKVVSILILSSALMITSSSAFAGVWVEAGGSAIAVSSSSSGTQSTSNTSYIGNGSAGYAFPQGFGVAAQGLSFHSTSSAETVFTYGPKAGLLMKGFELTAAYFVDAQDNVSGFNRAGSGFAVNLGYTFHVSGAFRAGVLYTYWQATYNTQNGVTLQNKVTQTYNVPQVMFALEF